ncbi:MAG: DUF434 domain-containing protein [Candidatus Parcubacteria bacterium]|nr:DUF434 domain-containing protein [Candidatus Parcubacteria bacterium]
MMLKEPRDVLKAAEDMSYLLNRGYPRKTALNLAVNHYKLGKRRRNYLVRCVFSDKEIKDHKSGHIPPEKMSGKDIVVDAYNVLITVESILCEKEIVMGMDGFLRDISAVFSSYNYTENSRCSLKAVLEAISSYKPRTAQFILDSQISRSGELAEHIRCELKRYGIAGDALTNRNADHEIKEQNRITLTSDSAIIEKVDNAVDISAEVRKRLLVGDL